MDIDLLSKMVKELILDKDMVVLPGLGTFTAEMMPATFSDKGFTINPPYRRLYFRSRTEEDRTLAEFYSRSNNVSPEVAERIISDFLTELKQVLREKKTVVFPGLGRLRATRENNFFFVPDEDLDIYPEGLGLSSISLKSHQESVAELSAAVSELKSIIDSDDTLQEEPESVQSESVQPEPEKLQEPQAQEEPAVENSIPDGPVSRPGPAVRIFVAVLSAIVILVILYIALNQLFPGIFDNLLYNKEQLEILDYGVE